MKKTEGVFVFAAVATSDFPISWKNKTNKNFVSLWRKNFSQERF